jgi:hypothetical protein
MADASEALEKLRAWRGEGRALVFHGGADVAAHGVSLIEWVGGERHEARFDSIVAAAQAVRTERIFWQRRETAFAIGGKAARVLYGAGRPGPGRPRATRLKSV